MDSPSARQAVDRLRRIISEGRKAMQGAPPETSASFEAMAAAAVDDIVGPESSYAAHLKRARDRPFLSTGGSGDPNARLQVGVLQGLLEDIQNGSLLQRTASLVAAEVFTDFLEMAEYLTGLGYKDPAASLSGAVLEEGMRRIARSKDVAVKPRDDIASLNTRLAQRDVYSLLRRKQIDAWGYIRNKADHGEFSEYSPDQVKEMIAGVRGFLGELL